MPSYRSITTSLVSQYDLWDIPEYIPPAAPKDPFTTIPISVDTDHAVVSVYIPIYPASQFWLCYNISPPNPPKLLYYFKLYLNGRHIVSWGCGAKNDFKGKTMFGVFDSTQVHENVPHSFFERRVLCFSPEAVTMQSKVLDSLNDVLEIKVFRSKGRKRIHPELQEYQNSSGMQQSDKKGTQRRADDGIDLVKAGFLLKKDPRSYYKYALYDPLDQPFATFRYYYRSWEQLEALGLVSPLPTSVTSSIRSLTPQQRPVSPENRDSVITSLASLSLSLENTMAQPAKSRGTRPARIARNDSHDSNNSAGTVVEFQSPGTSIASRNGTGSTDSSPFQIPRFNPLRMNRPPTPPPFFSPTKTLAQLPPTIPSTIPTLNLSLDSLNALNTLNPRASFASLIRTHLPDPDTSAFQLQPPTSPRQPRTPTRAPRSSSMGALINVINSAKKRRSSRVSEEGSDASSSLLSSEKTDEMLTDLIAMKKKREREEKRKEKKKRDENRKLHLWEEI